MDLQEEEVLQKTRELYKRKRYKDATTFFYSNALVVEKQQRRRVINALNNIPKYDLERDRSMETDDPLLDYCRRNGWEIVK